MSLTSLEPMSWVAWQMAYRDKIRVYVNWEKLRMLKPRVRQDWILFDSPHEVYIPHYNGGAWEDGEPRQMKPGSTSVILRAPALKIPGKKGRFLLLDGFHRYRDLRPRLLVLDALVVPKAALRYFLDMHNPAWKGFL